MACNKCGSDWQYRSFQIPKLEDPIPDELRTQEFFDSSLFFPYATISTGVGLNYLSFLHRLAKLSPTKEACVNFMIDVAFGDVQIVRQNDFYGVISESEVPENEAADFISVLNENLELKTSFQKLAKDICYTYLVDGNMATVEKIVEIDEVVRGFIEFAHTYDYVYLRGEDKEVAYSKEFHRINTRSELERKIEDGRVYVAGTKSFNKYGPMYIKLNHTKNGTNEYWGRPYSESSIYDQYGEYQSRVYLTTQAKYGFTVKTLMEKESLTDKEIKDLNRVFNTKNVYNNGEKHFQSALIMGRPEDSKPMTVHELKPFVDHQYFKETSKMFRENIITSHKISERLLGLATPNGFSANTYLDEYSIKLESVIKPLQRDVAQHINGSIRSVLGAMGVDYGNYYIKFKNSLDGSISDRSAEQLAT